MKQSAVVLCEPETNPDLQWVEEVAALLPEESRLGWYQNVRPWLRMLPPDDEVAHLAYSMGYLALLTRTTPALVAAERVRLTATLERISTEMAAAVKTTADYHHRLNNRLGQLPGEIAQGLCPEALADQIVASVREQFLNCGVPEVGRLLQGQVDGLRQLMTQHGDALIDFRQQLNESRSRAMAALNSVKASGDAAKESIDLWSKEMRQVQWMCLGLVLLLGLLMGALFYWWMVDPQEVPKTKQAAATQQSQPSAPESPRKARSSSR
jgi:hypothetical protein